MLVRGGISKFRWIEMKWMLTECLTKKRETTEQDEVVIGDKFEARADKNRVVSEDQEIKMINKTKIKN